MDHIADDSSSPRLLATCAVDANPRRQRDIATAPALLSVAPSCNGRLPDPSHLRVLHCEVAVVTADEDTNAVDTRHEAAIDSGVLGPSEEECAAALQCPVPAARHAVDVHESVCCVAEREARDSDVPHRVLLRASDIQKDLQIGRFKLQLCRWPRPGCVIVIVVQQAFARVKEEFIRGVEFLENVVNVPGPTFLPALCPLESTSSP
mmetsp:Transcript_55895/g.130184  ORF Transcript_55895/g.130184 Transcript_55895/m.130184 type:complete len:206 (+) Transcript_55895:1000-1617(+)